MKRVRVTTQTESAGNIGVLLFAVPLSVLVIVAFLCALFRFMNAGFERGATWAHLIESVCLYGVLFGSIVLFFYVLVRQFRR